MINKLGGRKFIVGILLIVLSFGLVCFGKLDVDSWTKFVVMIAGIYSGGNVATKLTQKL
jgi:amino acid permease